MKVFRNLCSIHIWIAVALLSAAFSTATKQQLKVPAPPQSAKVGEANQPKIIVEGPGRIDGRSDDTMLDSSVLESLNFSYQQPQREENYSYMSLEFERETAFDGLYRIL